MSILTINANETHYFSYLFDKVLYMFQTGPLSIIRSISTVYTQQLVFVMLVLLASASVVSLFWRLLAWSECSCVC